MAHQSVAESPLYGNPAEQGLGRKQREALEFIRACGGWHSYASDVRAIVMSLASRGLVEVSNTSKQFRAVHPVSCDQCQMLSINGVACHEQGCPNSRKTWLPERGEWVRFYDCPDCGYPVEYNTECGCQSDDSEVL